MGQGMVRAVVATMPRTNIILVHQPDSAKVVVQCQVCGLAMTYELPSGIPAFTAWVKKCEAAHAHCEAKV